MCFLGSENRTFQLSRQGWNRGWQDSFEITWRKHSVIPLSAYLPVPDSDPSLPLWASLAWHSGRSKSLSNVSARAVLTPGTAMLICRAPKSTCIIPLKLHNKWKGASNIHIEKLPRLYSWHRCSGESSHTVTEGLQPDCNARKVWDMTLFFFLGPAERILQVINFFSSHH